MNQSGFHTTHWSVVLAAKGDDTLARSALKTLCETYHIPVRRFIEREVAGDPSHRYGGRDADDLTQDFIAWLLEGETFTRLQRNRAKFRTYLLGAVKHFLSKTRERESAAKRGGGRKPVSLTTDHASVADVNDAFFDRDWAHSCVEQAIATLGDSDETNVLLPWLTAELSTTDRAELASRLGKSDAAIKVALHRLRKRFRESIRKHIAQTVESPEDINAELAYLIEALAWRGD
ncbi:MAG: RNA polymerase sigma factor [Thermoguttaceae bacterium]